MDLFQLNEGSASLHVIHAAPEVKIVADCQGASLTNGPVCEQLPCEMFAL